MSTYEVIHDFAGPVATIIASVTAAIVTTVFAVKQWKVSNEQAQIAFDKIKIEVMTDRIQVLNAARALIRLVVNARPGIIPGLAVMQVHQRVIDDGRFLFSDSTNEYLKFIINTCFDATDFAPLTDRRMLTDEQRAVNKSRTEAKKTIIKEMGRMPALLEGEFSPTYLVANSRTHRGFNYDLTNSLFSKIRVANFVLACIFGLILFIFTIIVATRYS